MDDVTLNDGLFVAECRVCYRRFESNGRQAAHQKRRLHEIDAHER